MCKLRLLETVKFGFEKLRKTKIMGTHYMFMNWKTHDVNSL